MQSIKFALLALLGASTMLGTSLISADAGDKSRKHARQQSKGKVHVSPTVSDKNLELLQRKLEGSSRHRATTQAVGKELHDRQTRRAMDRMLSTDDGASAILSLGNLADEILKGRKRRH